jgi:rubrerythrin
VLWKEENNKLRMEEKKFQKRVENFICEHCGFFVKGSGYTDHCPKCLWSKHVDINPGDRESGCNGMMKPIGIKIEQGEYVIYYQCIKCGYKHRVKSNPEDNFEEILKLSKQPFVKDGLTRTDTDKNP